MSSSDERNDARLIVKSTGGRSKALSGMSGMSGAGEDVVHRAFLAQKTPITDSQLREALTVERSDLDGKSLSLYVHLPFCPSRCLTCDHHSTVTHDLREIDRYLDALESEIELLTASLGRSHHLQQLHLGGGTPNYLSEIQLVRLIEMIDQHFTIDDQTEATLDANAHRASQSQLGLLHGLGFRGLNLEIRDLDPQVQQAVGRSQSLPVIRDVVEMARDIGFTRISTDLVYGLPRQTSQTMRRTLEQLLALNPDRISCYSHSRRQRDFEHQRAVDSSQLPSLADKMAIFSRIVDTLCGSNDFEWIGLDSFARREDPLAKAQACGTLHRNWIGYTTHSGRGVLGLGNSAVTDLSQICVRSQPRIDEWRRCLERGELPVQEGELLTAERREQRQALSELMCNMQSTRVAPLLSGGGLEVTPLVEDGLLEVADDRVSVTEAGRYLLHRVWGDSAPAHRWAHLA